MADFTPQEQEEFEFRLRLEREQAQAAQQKQAAPAEDKTINPLVPSVGSAVAANFAAPGINAMTKELEKFQTAKQLGVNPSQLTLAAGPGGTDRWVLSSGMGLGDSPDIKGRLDAFKAAESELEALKARQNAPIGGIAKHGTRAATLGADDLARMAELEKTLGPDRIASLAKIQAQKDAAMQAARPLAEKMGMSPRAAQGLDVLNSGLSKAVPAVLGRSLAGGATAFEGVDAYNRLQSGDIAGGLIGGLGALGSAASFIPHPVTRIGGTALGMGAAALNAYLDSLKEQAAAKKNKPVGGLPQQ